MKLNNQSHEMSAKPNASIEFQWALAGFYLIILVVLSIVRKNALILEATFLAIVTCYLLLEIGTRLMATAFLIFASFLDFIIASIRSISKEVQRGDSNIRNFIIASIRGVSREVQIQRGHFPSFHEGIANIWRCESVI